MAARERCSYHCGGCHSCFSSLASFDRHRVGSHRDGRRCLAPDDVPGLVAKTESGSCSLGGTARVGVVVWSVGRDLERWAAGSEAA